MRSTFVPSLGTGVVVLALSFIRGVHASIPALFDHRSADFADNTGEVQRRDTKNTLALPLIQLAGKGYGLNVTIGTPAQYLTLQISALSSASWVNVDNSTWCEENSIECFNYGTYSPDYSSTFKMIEFDYFDFDYNYAAGYFDWGSTVNDTLKLGTATLKDFQFGIANQSIRSVGGLGLGYYTDEDSLYYPDTITAYLVERGFVEINAYSLWLSGPNSTEGQLVFGGVDTTKFVGSLETIPILSDYQAPFIQLANLQLQGDGSNNSITKNIGATVAAPDPGELATYLPVPYYQKLVDLLGASKYPILNGLQSATGDPIDSLIDVPPDGLQGCNCSLLQNTSTLQFGFYSSSASALVYFPVPVSDFVGKSAGQCYLTILPNIANSTAILGTNFLQSYYVVYDLTNNQVSIAPANYDSRADSPNIVAIPPSGISKNSIFQGVTTGGGTAKNSTTTGSISSPTSSPQGACTSHCGLSTGATAGIGVGSGVGALLLAGVLFFFCRRHRRRHPRYEAADTSEKEVCGENLTPPMPVEPPPGMRQELEGPGSGGANRASAVFIGVHRASKVLVGGNRVSEVPDGSNHANEVPDESKRADVHEGANLATEAHDQSNRTSEVQDGGKQTSEELQDDPPPSLTARVVSPAFSDDQWYHEMGSGVSSPIEQPSRIKRKAVGSL